MISDGGQVFSPPYSISHSPCSLQFHIIHIMATSFFGQKTGPYQTYFEGLQESPLQTWGLKFALLDFRNSVSSSYAFVITTRQQILETE